MRILVTGAAGFIGYHLTKRLATDGHEVTGLDNLNDYYDPELKYARLKELGVVPGGDGSYTDSDTLPGFTFVRGDIKDGRLVARVFEKGQFDTVVNLAAQAGVRYSIEQPRAYIESNIDGLVNVLEGCRHHRVAHMVSASSSSVYGLSASIPYTEEDPTSHPVSVYAATKKSGEMLAHAYSHLFRLPVTCLRFFTVYGPWGRPDMSPCLFADAICSGREIKVFNHGNMMRDFTYIDDVVEAVVRVITRIPEPDKQWDPEHPSPATSSAPFRIYNVGNSKPVRLLDFISEIEKAVGRPAPKLMMPMQPGDVERTWADTTALNLATGFKPSTPLAEGVKATIDWYKRYYNRS